MSSAVPLAHVLRRLQATIWHCIPSLLPFLLSASIIVIKQCHTDVVSCQISGRFVKAEFPWAALRPGYGMATDHGFPLRSNGSYPGTPWTSDSLH